MSKGLVYCHMCGSILQRNENKQIVARDWATKKSKMLFDVCPQCAAKVENMKLPVARIKNRKRFSFTSIIIRDVEPRKRKTVYDVLPNQLEYIKQLEVPLENLKLTYATGKRLYTNMQVKKWILLERANLIEAMYMLYNHQTEDEKAGRETKYANSVGFNKPDADFLSGMSRIYECAKDDNRKPRYTVKQYKAIEKRVLKYIKQLTLYINAEGKILRGV